MKVRNSSNPSGIVARCTNITGTVMRLRGDACTPKQSSGNVTTHHATADDQTRCPVCLQLTDSAQHIGVDVRVQRMVAVTLQIHLQF